MTLDLTDQEREYLEELLEAAHKNKLHGLHHAQTSDYKLILKDKVRIIEALESKLMMEKKSA